MQCTAAASNATTIGGLRAAATPLQTAYSFAAASLPEADSWPLVDAPHDALFSLNGSFSEPGGDERHGYRVRTVAWYRKNFVLPAEWAPSSGGATFVRFEGVHHFAQLWLNGAYLVAHSSSYGEFVVRLDNSTAAVFGGANVLAVRADAGYGSEHWYGGGGLIRNVQLVHVGARAFVEGGVWLPPELDAAAASATAVGEFENFGAAAASAVLHVALLDAAGARVANATSAPVAAAPGGVAVASVALPMQWAPARWSGAAPALYTAVFSLLAADGSGALLDQRNFSTGFRSTRWDAEKGFFINGAPLKQRGFSHHNSFAGVGVAIPPRLDLFRVQASRTLGANMCVAGGVDGRAAAGRNLLKHPPTPPRSADGA